MGRVTGDRLSSEDVNASTDPAALLDFAWAMEPALRLTERWAALDRLEALVQSGELAPAPPGRDWAMELTAERAFDAAAYVRLQEGQDLANRVLAEADPDAQIARARATLALGRALAWMGTEEATRRGNAQLQAAIELFRRLDHPDWLGFTLFWRGHAVCFQNGDLTGAAALMHEALEVLGPDSPRRAPVLAFYADVLSELGDLDAADRALDQAAHAAQRDGSARSRAYAAWSRAHVSTARDDAAATLELLAEVEAVPDEWLSTMAGLDYLADSAVLLDRVGLTAPSRQYLERARQFVAERGATTADGTQIDEPLRLAEASLQARSGDPHEALARLEELVRGNWLEKRLTWRNTLLSAWATLRAGGREGAGQITARALAEAAENGGVPVALAGEPLLTRALLPLADEAGSGHARAVLMADGRFTLRLFGTTSIRSPEGQEIALPAGKPGELVRWLAVTPQGLRTTHVLAAFFPDVDRTTGLQRLRQILTRVRAAAGDLVRREREQLTLAPAWVDVRAFRDLAYGARDARGTRRLELAWAAMALAARGPLLTGDPYVSWADAAREETTEITTELTEVISRATG